MLKLRDSIAAKLVLGYGVLGMVSMVAVSAVFYVGTIGVLDQNIDGRIIALSDRLLALGGERSSAALAIEVRRQLSDGIDSDREIFLLQRGDGRVLAGNLSAWPGRFEGALQSADVVRDGRITPARLHRRLLPDGSLLIVGRDLSEQEAIRALVWRALASGAVLSLLFTVLGALLFRGQIESRLGAIRRTAEQIEAGDLSRRIPVRGDDEFARLNGDINRMLDHIELLMDGVRHVSDAIAHDLRTPLGRVRGKLEDALRHTRDADALEGAARDAIDDIDDLIRLFERLLQIAEAESGVRARLFETLDLNRVAEDLAEMYEASAEDVGARLSLALAPRAVVLGDRNLLASAVASLLDNALKYAGQGAAIVLSTSSREGKLAIAVGDNGPGIPAGERGRVTERFYRLDQSRNLPGNGLGLSIVQATAVLHGGALELADNQPGLLACIVLPPASRPPAVTI
ncbi:sensor histidine kinase [Rugamonas apoptosis]|uniref:histidine kinase n=1 Tax=Rugamonas apoptosis TaxID=2758570 RepID=A0A7W2FFH1_9BURK|nr:HAMP domain-containing sensor histidine kinase [Rugamonas apoptosis]MBA5690726.1 HAMP domain-containing histidine kinase [Rugamonas apoptosis]